MGFDLEKIKDLPVLDTCKRIGGTRYIDFIEWDEIKYPAMRDLDRFKSPFVVIKMIINKIPIMQTFFQRYSDNTNLWMGAGAIIQN